MSLTSTFVVGHACCALGMLRMYFLCTGVALQQMQHHGKGATVAASPNCTLCQCSGLLTHLVCTAPPQAFPTRPQPYSAQRTAPAATLFKPARSHATRHAHSARPCRVSSQSWGILRSSWLWRRERQSAATKFAMETLISAD